jgi:FkbM family methyltransferase
MWLILLHCQIVLATAVAISVHYPMWSFNETFTFATNQKHVRDIHVPFAGWKNFTQSMNHEDIDAYETYFYGLHKGLVLETGGGEFSATTFFEQVVGWRAIHVEADTKIFRKLKTTRANQINVHCALCADNRLVHFVPSQFNAAGVYEQMSPKFLNAWHKELVEDPKRVDALPKVPCITVTKLLQRLGVQHVDLWVLDTDGTEEDILKGLDTDKISIDVIAFHDERAHGSGGQHMDSESDKKAAVLEKRGYDCSRHAHENRWCKRKDFVNVRTREKGDKKKKKLDPMRIDGIGSVTTAV